MPPIARKLLIFAAADGLILQPLQPKNQTQQDVVKKERIPPIKIEYKNANITSSAYSAYNEKERAKGFEAFGIVGEHSILSTCFE